MEEPASSSQSESKQRINVGGHVFMSTTQTLTAHADSMLARMFSAPWTGNGGGGTERFIDRDGRHFHHILNYLRDGRKALPSDRHVLRHLLNEAEFYQLNALQDDIQLLVSLSEPSGSQLEPVTTHLQVNDRVRWRADAIQLYWRPFALCMAEHARLGDVSRSNLLLFFEMSVSDQPPNAPSRQRSFCMGCLRTDYLDDVSVYTTQVHLDNWTAVQHYMQYMNGVVHEVIGSTCCVVNWENGKRVHLPLSAVVTMPQD